ncbi:MAG: ABC transporter substrate-binding protein [Phycisphaerae bacterium]|nr:ABC transporter substrate-binding protein [Phycisphaerae bacterium]
MRVVSLLPSASEIVCALGPRARAFLVGRSHECDFPPDLACLPSLTQAAITPGLDPSAIDAAVREASDSHRSLYRLNAELLTTLRPDLILTQDLCHVCSIDLEAVRAVARRLAPSPRVLSLNPASVEGVLDDVLAVGEALGLAPEALALVTRLRERLFAAADFVNPYADGPSVAVLEWTDPLFVAGHWTPQLVERAGARHPLNPTSPRPRTGLAVGPQQGERLAGPSRTITPDDLIASNPEVIVICPCGLSLADALRAADHLARQPWWPSLPAVRAGRVAVVDGNQMLSRPGPRLVDAFEWLVGWLHDRPEIIPPGFPWRPMP